MRIRHQRSGLRAGRVALAAVMAVGLLVGSRPSLADVGQPGLDDSDALFVPLRWCALQGSPAVTNPAGVGEPDTESVLWRRHERATDYIWFPGALISFRSAFTAMAQAAANYPVIADPEPPPTGAGQVGDINIDSATEFAAMRASCLQAWDAIELQVGGSFEGPLAFNVRQFVHANGSPSSLWGTASYAFSYASTPGGPSGPCDNVVTANDGQAAFAAVRDNSFGLAADPHDRLLAHEVGHTLFLGHGNGLDDDGDGAFDGCDGAYPFYPHPAPPESATAAPDSIMTASGSSEVVTTRQRGTVAAGTAAKLAGARGLAKVTSGAQYDPPVALVDVRVRSDHRVDRVRDAPRAVDIVSAGFARNDDLKRFVLTHTLFGTLPAKGSFEYDLFLDLDHRFATGGAPRTLGFPTLARGVELLTSVTVTGGGPRRVSVRAWRFRGGAFMPIPPRVVTAALSRSFLTDTNRPLFDSVVVQIPSKHVAPVSQRVHQQAVARTLGPGRSDLDRLPDRGRAMRPFYLAPLRYPQAVLTPARARPGETVTVAATGLIPGGTAKLYLGDRWVARAPIGERGALRTRFIVPAEARAGPRLVTVGVMGSALSADALLVVQ